MPNLGLLYYPFRNLTKHAFRCKYRKKSKSLCSILGDICLFSSSTKTTQTTVFSGYHPIPRLFNLKTTGNRKQSNHSVSMFFSSSSLILAPTQQTFVHFSSEGGSFGRPGHSQIQQLSFPEIAVLAHVQCNSVASKGNFHLLQVDELT